MVTPAMLNQLRASFGSCTRISEEHYAKLKRTVGKLPTSDLRTIADGDIPFVSTAAVSVLVDRKALPASAKWEHAIDTITKSVLAERAVRATA